MAAVDSLIRLDIDVPEATLTSMAKHRLDEVLIFIARRPAQFSHLVEQLLRQQLEDHDWVALNSILASRPPIGFAAALLQAWTIRLTVIANDRNYEGGGAVGGGSIVDGASFVRPGFPPLEAYSVVEDPQPGDVLLANGLHPVWYRKQAGYYRSMHARDRDAYRRDYLFQLAGISAGDPRFGPLQTATLNIEWKSEAAFRADAQETMRRARDSLNSLKAHLVERRLLSQAVANQVIAKFDVLVLDHRRVQKPPLPVMNWTLATSESRR